MLLFLARGVINQQPPVVPAKTEAGDCGTEKVHGRDGGYWNLISQVNLPQLQNAFPPWPTIHDDDDDGKGT